MNQRNLLSNTPAQEALIVRPIEQSFPIAEISLLAERESWRKEIFRPIYHGHKWWANRLGSIFRAIILGAIAEPGQEIWSSFYQTHDFRDKIVLDPFMGSGTTLGEAAKLGARPVGCDINPISTFAVTQALTRVEIAELEREFRSIEYDIKNEINRYYKTLDPLTGQCISVLYYFWVKVVETPSGEVIPLFNSYVFSKNAHPKKKPEAKIICPKCWQILTARYDVEVLPCFHCNHTFNPQKGPAHGRYVTDSLGNTFAIKTLIHKKGSAPHHKLYAIMALRDDAEKMYLTPQDYDFELLRSAADALQRATLPLPTLSVRQGHNTNQARGYHYLTWRDFFNDRQLLCLGMLLERILKIPSQPLKDQFLCLFSSTLEFNNVFCSFKGEGTGAVRHMFSHHILKPERTPLENNVWGTPKSSGSFSTLFKSRLLKAKQYLDEPFEIALEHDILGEAINTTYVTASQPLRLEITQSWDIFESDARFALVLNGDSGSLPIPDSTVDAIVTDPPYFDFVHYSELSDFFFAWLAPVVAKQYPFFGRESSYHEGEVQSKQPNTFAVNLARVFRECSRVIKNNGILAFSFHHSRPAGWAAIYQALHSANFRVVAAYPVHAEMRGARPKRGTKEPISIDVILVCKKKQDFYQPVQHQIDIPRELCRAGITPSQTDWFNIEASALLVAASCEGSSPSTVQRQLAELQKAPSRV